MTDSQEPDFDEQDIFENSGETGQIVEIQGDPYHAMENHGLTVQEIEDLGEDAIREDAYAWRVLQMMRSDSPESGDPGDILMMRNFATPRLNTSPVLEEPAEELTFEDLPMPGPDRTLTAAPNAADEDFDMRDPNTSRRRLRIVSVSPDLEDMDNTNVGGSIGSPMSAVASLGSHSSTDTVIWNPHAVERPEATSPAPVVRRQGWQTLTLRQSPPPFHREGSFRFQDLPRRAKEIVYRFTVDRQCDLQYRYRNMSADINTGIWIAHNSDVPFRKPALTDVCRETRRGIHEAIKKVPRIIYPSMIMPFLSELNDLRFDLNEPSAIAPAGSANLQEFTMFWLFTKKWGLYQTHTSTDTAFNMMAKVTITDFPAGRIAVRSTPKTGAEGPNPYYDDGELVAWLDRAGIPVGFVDRKAPNPGYWQRWSVVEFETFNVVDDVEALHKALWDVDLLNPLNPQD